MKSELDKEIVKCICGKWTRPKIFRIEGMKIRGSECKACGEGYFNPDDALLLSEYRKIKDEVLEGKITKSGNSYVVRLPIQLVRALGLKKGGTVQLTVRDPKEIILRTD